MLSQSQVSSFWYREAIKEISAEPTRWLALMVKKLWLFWHGQEIYNTSSVYDGGDVDPYLKLAVWKNTINFPSGLLLPVGLAGLLWAIRKRMRVAVAASYLMTLALAVSVFFVCSRFRQPVVPIVSMFAAFAVGEWLSLAKSRMLGLLSALSILIIGLVVIFNAGGDVDSTQNYAQALKMKGSVLVDNRRYTDAVTLFEQAVRIDPLDAGTIDLLGSTLIKLNKLSKAEEIYRKGLTISPSHPIFNQRMGEIALRTNRCQDALDYFRHSLYTAPENLPALDGIGISFRILGQLDSALYYRQKVAGLLPPDSLRQAEIEQLKRQITNE